ncbi:Bromodomain and PHD finger-containing protein 3, partial [Cucurbita argyrosperma subsp. sororia]
MGKVVERKKRKKGRPSLLDLQKRNLKEQQEQEEQEQEQKQKHHHQTKRINTSTAISNPNYASPTPLRRSTRRNPNPDALTPDEVADDHEDAEYNDQLAANRRERKLKLVVRLHSPKSPVNSSSLNSCRSDSNADVDGNAASINKKRKIDTIGEGSRIQHSEKDEKSMSATNPSETLQGSHMDSAPSTPLPDKKLLVFILDRLQKKDIYGVFSEPVDPNELPDYHEIIEHPMDFGTVREKLTSGAYSSLEQFEKDVLLISSNAMQYNSSDTIYYRQARTIQELAKKSFKNLRQDSDDNEPEPKVVRRGRPPTKNLKKPLGRPPLERAGSEFSPDATLVTGGENTNRSNDLRKGLHHFEKPGLADFSGRFSFSSNSEAAFNLFNQNRFDRSEDMTGSALRFNSVRQGKKPIVSDENRRDTYKQFQAATTLLEPSVLNTFDRERKVLMPVGLFLEHAYARSLARFAADLGSVAWRVASKKIERILPTGSSFGPGWVVEDDTTPKRVFLPQAELGQKSTLHESLAPDVKPLAPEQKTVRSSDNSEADTSSKMHDEPSHVPSSDGYLPSRPPAEFSAASSSSPSSTRQSSEPCRGQTETVEGLNPSSDYNVLESSIPISRPSLQKHENLTIRHGMNGFNGAYGFDLSAHRGKLIGASSEPAGVKPQSSSQMLEMISRTNANFILPAMATRLNLKEPKCPENNLGTTNSSSSLLGSGNETLMETPWRQRQQPQPQQPQGPSSAPAPEETAVTTTTTTLYKPESVPPDLNVRFKSPGSPPPSSSKVDSAHPDLVLQL